MKKILLVYAGIKSKLPRFPLSCLVLASYLRKNGYDPEIYDARIEPGISKINQEKYSCVCISSMTGRALKSAIEISKFFKAYNPIFPVIWGGASLQCSS